jgi:hypothetical protein
MREDELFVSFGTGIVAMLTQLLYKMLYTDAIGVYI